MTNEEIDQWRKECQERFREFEKKRRQHETDIAIAQLQIQFKINAMISEHCRIAALPKIEIEL